MLAGFWQASSTKQLDESNLTIFTLLCTHRHLFCMGLDHNNVSAGVGSSSQTRTYEKHSDLLTFLIRRHTLMHAPIKIPG
jgi:hypothetical protein